MDPKPAAPAPAPAPAADPAALAPGAPPPAAAAPAGGAPPPAAPAAGDPNNPANPAGAAPAPAAQPPKPAEPPKEEPVAIEVKLPEGAKVDEKVLGEFKGIMADKKLTPAQKAQALIDLQFRQFADAAKAAEEAFQQARAKDMETLKADKEFGGANYDKNVAASQSAVKQFGGEELSKVLKAFGLDNHPAVVKTFVRIRAAIAEDSISGTQNGAPPPVAAGFAGIYDHPTSAPLRR